MVGSSFFFKFEQKVLHLFWFLEIGLPWKDGIDLELKKQELFWKILKVKLKLWIYTKTIYVSCTKNLFICIFGGFGYLAKDWSWTLFIQSWMCYIFFIISFDILNKFWGNPLDPFDRVELLKAFLRFWYFQPWWT